jgi:hypothetical protein
MPAAPAAGAATNVGGVFLSSLIDCYADIPSVLLLARSLQEVGPPSHPSRVGASYGSSHPSRWPDPEELNVATYLPSSLWVGHSQHRGYSSYPYSYGRRYDPVSPLCHGGASVSLAARPDPSWVPHLHGGLPPGSPICRLGGNVPLIYGGPTYCSDGFPRVVCSVPMAHLMTSHNLCTHLMAHLFTGFHTCRHQ